MVFAGKRKKGSIQDLIFIMGGLVVIAIILLISFKLGHEFNTNIQADPTMPATAKTATNQLTGYFTSVGDSVFLFITIGLALAALAMAALVRVHPIFLVFFIIILIILIFISGILSNIYQGMAVDPQLSTEANQLTFTSFIIIRLPLFIGILGILLMIVMYKVYSNE